MEHEPSTQRSARGRVLVVDDDPGIRDMVAAMLQIHGYPVTLAADGAQALQQLERPPLPHLILLDVMMPVMDGWQFRAELLKDATLATIPVVITSGISADYQLKGHLQSVAYLEKPFTEEQLLSLVRQYCN